MRGFFLFFLASISLMPSLLGQCISLKSASFLVSDRYTSVTEYNNYLVLVNEFGLIYRDLANPGAAPIYQESVPGEITHVFTKDDLLYLIARNEGLYVYDLPESSAFPQKRAFYSVPGLQTAYVEGNRLFAALTDKVALFRLEGKDDTVLLDTWEGTQNRILASGNLLILHQENGPVTLLPFTSSDFGSSAKRLSLDGVDIFYGIYQQDDMLLVDSPSGIQWVRFNNDASVASNGYIYNNANSDIVQGLASNENMLTLRFSDRIDVRKRDLTGQWVSAGSIPLSFTQLGFSKLFLVANRIHLLNTNPRNRNWSLRSYTVDASTSQYGEVAANFGDIIGAATLGQRLFVATEGRVFEVTQTGQDAGSLRLVFELGEPLVNFSGTESHLVATTIADDTTSSRITWLEPFGTDQLQAIHEEQFTGAVETISSYGNQVAVLQHFRKTDGEHYLIHVVTPSSNGFWQNRQVEEIFPFQTPNPFRDLQLSDLGISHHDGNTITVRANIDQLRITQTYQPEIESPILKLASKSSHFWIETAQGLQVVMPGNGTLDLKSKYDHWFNLLNRNNFLLAQSSKDRLPSRFHLLQLEDSGIVQSQVAFSLSGDPLLVDPNQTSIVTIEKNAFNQFEMNCPPQNFNYLIPFAAGLEMEINTLGNEGDLITLSIFKEDGDIIGVQSLTPELLRQFNGSLLMEWLFDFNRDEAPFSFVLSSSRPLNPIISGFATAALSSRFAYTVPPWGTSELLVPHIPQNQAVWNTELFIRNFNESDDTSIVLSSPNGNSGLRPINNGGTQIINVSEDAITSAAPWAKIQSLNLDTRLSGFSLYQDAFHQQAASVPMSSTGSDFLILPNLIGTTRQGWWTGLVLANTNPQNIFIRALGYDQEGQILLDRIVEIESEKSLVVIAESWLEGLRKRDDIKWLAISAELPIVGMVLFGDGATHRLAGLQLSSDVSLELQFSGVRSSEEWESILQVTNIGNERGLLIFEAFDGEGEFVALETREIAPKGLHDESVLSLFPSLSVPQRADIQTVRVRCNTSIAGFMFRELFSANALEAVSPYAPPY